MRIGIDASEMLVSQKTGIERYSTELILALAKLLPSNPDMELFLYYYAGNKFADSALLGSYLSQLAGVRIRAYNYRRGYRLALPIMVALDRLDLLHIPQPSMPWFATCPTLISFHDASWAHLPEYGRTIEGDVTRASKERAITKANAFLAVSENAKADLVKLYGISSERICVVYHGVDSRYRPDSDAAQKIKHKYDLGPYILNVAALQYRKNQVRLVETFDQLKRQYSIPHSLVIAGRRGWGFQQVYDKVAELHLDSHVKFLGYVPDSELPGLYNGADLFVYPSLHEGFGMPLLEAMACGAVIAASNRSSIPEIVGEAAAYFDPYNVEEMTSSLHKALVDTVLRETLIKKGFQRIAPLTWEHAAQKTISIYHRIYTLRRKRSSN